MNLKAVLEIVMKDPSASFSRPKMYPYEMRFDSHWSTERTLHKMNEKGNYIQVTDFKISDILVDDWEIIEPTYTISKSELQNISSLDELKKRFQLLEIQKGPPHE